MRASVYLGKLLYMYNIWISYIHIYVCDALRAVWASGLFFLYLREFFRKYISLSNYCFEVMSRASAKIKSFAVRFYLNIVTEYNALFVPKPWMKMSALYILMTTIFVVTHHVSEAINFQSDIKFVFYNQR